MFLQQASYTPSFGGLGLSNVMTHRTRSDVPIILPRRFHSEALGLRNQLLSFRMDFRPKLQNYEYGPDLMDDSPEDRVNEVIAPIKVLAIDDNAPLRLITDTAQALQEELLAGKRDTTDARIIEVLFDIHNKGDGAQLSAKAVADRIVDEMDDSKPSPNAHKVDSLVTRPV